jgi:hypothetical protein
MANTPRLHGDVVEGKRFAKFVVDFLEAMNARIDAAQAAASSSTSTTTTISGSGVTGSPETGYIIAAPAAGLTLGKALQAPNLATFY